MLTSYRQAYNTTVYAEIERGKLPVGFFIDFVIDPDTGNAAALWIQTLQGKKCLDPSDIVHWRSSEILIRKPDNCFDPSESPKITKLFEKECAILGSQVYRAADQKLIGQVRNFGFDTISPRLLSLHIRSHWWQPWKKQIIPHERIDKITPKGIFVHDQAITKEPEPLKKKVTEAIKSVDERPTIDCEE